MGQNESGHSLVPAMLSVISLRDETNGQAIQRERGREIEERVPR